VYTYIGISENGPRINNGIAAHTKWNRRLKKSREKWGKYERTGGQTEHVKDRKINPN